MTLLKVVYLKKLLWFFFNRTLSINPSAIIRHILSFALFDCSEPSMSEEQLARQLISLHRAVSHRDKAFLRQLMRRCENKLDMSAPLRGVTALSLSVYLKHNDMTSELLSIMKQTRQIGKEIIKFM